METKISIAEIEQLRQAAVAERTIRKRVTSLIENVRSGVAISAEDQMEILRRENEKECQMLLEAYAGENSAGALNHLPTWPMMSPEAQIYIYENRKAGFQNELWEYLIDYVPLTDEFAKRLIDDGEYSHYQKISAKVQCYYVERMFSQAEKKSELEFYISCQYLNRLMNYFKEYDLAPKAELLLVTKGLDTTYSRERFIEYCRQMVELYINVKKALTPAAERALIASGNHDVIMLYIRIAEEGLKEEEALLARGNREEVTAYFERYAIL